MSQPGRTLVMFLNVEQHHAINQVALRHAPNVGHRVLAGKQQHIVATVLCLPCGLQKVSVVFGLIDITANRRAERQKYDYAYHAFYGRWHPEYIQVVQRRPSPYRWFLAEMERLPESTYETVLTDTPASRATSLMPVIFRLLRLSKSFALHVMRTAALVHRSTKPSAEPSGISSAESRSYFIESFRRNVSLIVSQQLSFVKRFDTPTRHSSK